MAASCKEKDFVHQVVDKLETDFEGKYGKVNPYALNYFVWEVQAADRAETFTLIDPYLSEQLDLVTIQLGENVVDLTTFEEDLEELVEYIKKKCEKAAIILIGEFWEDWEKDEVKRRVADKCGVIYIDLKEIQGHSEYQAGLGTYVYGEDGEKHKIEHEGVAKHPGDKGMEYIADRIIEVLSRG